MKHRIAWLTGTAAVVIGAAYWMLPSATSDAPRSGRRPTKVATRDVAPSLAPVAEAHDKPKMVLTESGWQPQGPPRQPRVWMDPVTGARNRELLDAVPDPAAAAAEELKYRKSRLRLTLADAAAPCWTGGDSREEIELEYTLIVEKETIRADNVRVKTSNITNPTVQRCIIDSVRDLRSLGDKIPDMREEQGLTMSLHELHDRNERETKNSRAQSEGQPELPRSPVAPGN